MNALRPVKPKDTEDHFEELAKLAWALRCYSEIVERYADLHDRTGLHNALRSCDDVLQRAVHLYNEVRGANAER